MEEQLINCLDKNVECFNLKNLEFICKITNVYDADTCRVVFFFNNQLIKYTLRLKGIDTPEIRPKLIKPNREQEIKFAKKARNRLIQLSTSVNIDLDLDISKSKLQKLINDNTKLIKIHCYEFDKYGRLLAELKENDNQICYNDILINEGYAKKYDGGTKNVWFP